MENKELTFVRLFNAPRERVFSAWTKPQLISQWWGPRLFTIPVCRVDLNVNGEFYLEMESPDGQKYPMDAKFLEIIPNKKLVFVAVPIKDEGGNILFETVTSAVFEDFNGMTKMTINVKVTKSSPAAQTAILGMEQGWSETLYKLADFLDLDIK